MKQIYFAPDGRWRITDDPAVVRDADELNDALGDAQELLRAHHVAIVKSNEPAARAKMSKAASRKVAPLYERIREVASVVPTDRHHVTNTIKQLAGIGIRVSPWQVRNALKV